MLHTLNGFFHIVGNVSEQLIPFVDHDFHLFCLGVDFGVQVFRKIAQFLFLRNEYPCAETGGINENDGSQPENRVCAGERTEVGQTGGGAYAAHDYGRDQKGDVCVFSPGGKKCEYQNCQGEKYVAEDAIPRFPGGEVVRYDLQNEKGYCTDGH